MFAQFCLSVWRYARFVAATVALLWLPRYRQRVFRAAKPDRDKSYAGPVPRPILTYLIHENRKCFFLLRALGYPFLAFKRARLARQQRRSKSITLAIADFCLRLSRPTDFADRLPLYDLYRIQRFKRLEDIPDFTPWFFVFVAKRLQMEGDRRVLWDKLAFERRAAVGGYRTAVTLGLIEDRRWHPLRAGNGSLPREDLITKPMKGSFGRGVERWEFNGDYQCCGGTKLTAGQLVDHLAKNSRPILVQRRLINEDSLRRVVGATLATLRVVTFVGMDKPPTVLFSYLRSGVGGPTDNLHAGGMAIHVDRETACMTRGLAWEGGEGREIAIHPETEVAFPSCKVPCFRQAEDLALRAHQFFGLQRVLGWDIALTYDGPTLLEANSVPGVMGWELLEKKPFCSHDKFAEIVSLAWGDSANE